MNELKPNPQMSYAEVVENIKKGMERTLRAMGGTPKLRFVAVKFYFLDEGDKVLYTYVEKAKGFDFKDYEDEG